MIDMIEDGYDLAIRTVPPPDSTLVVRKLTPWRHVLACSPSYLESHEAPTAPGDLKGHDCLQYSYYPFGDEWHFVSAAGNQENVRVHGTVLSNSAEALRYLAVNGRAVWLAPSFVLYDDLAAGRLVRIMPE